MNNNQEKITVISSQKPLIPKPVIILLIVSAIAIILLAGYLYLPKNFFKQNKPAPAPIPNKTPAPASSSATPAIKPPTPTQSVKVESFTASVKEIKNNKLTLETQDKNPQTIEIPLDQNITFQIRTYKNKLPTLQKATPSDLKTNQTLAIRKTTLNNNQPIFEITILNL